MRTNRYKGFLFILIATVVMIISGCASSEKRDIKKEADAHYQLALSHLQSARVQDAFVELQKTIRIDPKNKRAYYLLGLIYRRFNDNRAAEDALLKALALDPDYSEAHNALGVVLTAQRRWDEAVKEFKLALKNPLYLNPEKPYYNMGNVYYRQGRYKDALRAYKSAITRRPDFHLPYYGIALSYNMLKRYGDAADALEKAIKLDPNLRGNKQKAEEFFKEMKLRATDPDVEQDYSDLLDILYY